MYDAFIIPHEECNEKDIKKNNDFGKSDRHFRGYNMMKKKKEVLNITNRNLETTIDVKDILNKKMKLDLSEVK